jgi:hypothetical protein
LARTPISLKITAAENLPGTITIIITQMRGTFKSPESDAVKYHQADFNPPDDI